jgi:multisubunit Na+/H+ antiporter MnhG subunit
VAVIAAVLVSFGVAAELVCCAGLIAMRNAVDRLHYAAAGTTVGPSLVAAAVCVEEGLFSANGLNALAVALMLALLGAALASVTGHLAHAKERGRGS